MSDEKYNGWTNKPTWLVVVWLDNEQGGFDYKRNLYMRAVEQVFAKGEKYSPAWKVDIAGGIGDIMSEDYAHGDEWSNNQLGNGLHSDLLSWALAHINWNEIGHSVLEEVLEEVTA